MTNEVRLCSGRIVCRGLRAVRSELRTESVNDGREWQASMRQQLCDAFSLDFNADAPPLFRHGIQHGVIAIIKRLFTAELPVLCHDRPA